MEKKPCEKGCLEHKYHCAECFYPMTFSPANFASRPHDIPNPCQNCMKNRESTPPTPEAGEWEKNLEAVWNRAGLHLGYKNHKVEVIKDFIRSLLAARDEELIRKIEAEKYENKNLPPYEYKTYHRTWDYALDHVISLIRSRK